jgi:hypothetical protein
MSSAAKIAATQSSSWPNNRAMSFATLTSSILDEHKA